MNTEYLWYLCLTCGNARQLEHRPETPQRREKRLTCWGQCGTRTKHRLAGLGPIRRKEGCPTWCTDHQTWRDGTEEHRHIMVTRQGWHKFLGRWDCTTLEITQLIDRPDIRRKDETMPTINCNLSIASLEQSRLVLGLLSQAIELLDAEARKEEANA